MQAFGYDYYDDDRRQHMQRHSDSYHRWRLFTCRGRKKERTASEAAEGVYDLWTAEDGGMGSMRLAVCASV